MSISPQVLKVVHLYWEYPEQERGLHRVLWFEVLYPIVKDTPLYHNLIMDPKYRAHYWSPLKVFLALKPQ